MKAAEASGVEYKKMFDAHGTLKSPKGTDLEFATSLFEGRGPPSIPCNICKKVQLLKSGFSVCIAE